MSHPALTKCAKQGCTKPSTTFKQCNVCSKSFHVQCGEFSSYKDKTKPDELVRLCMTCNAIPANSIGLLLRYQPRSNSSSSQSSIKRKALDLEASEGSDEDEEEPDAKTILRAIKKGNASTNKLVADLSATVQGFNNSLNSRCDGIDDRIQALQQEIVELKKSHAAEMSTVNQKLVELDFRCNNTVFVHGHSQADSPGLDIKKAVTKLAEYLEVTITDRDISSSRIIKRRPDNTRLYASVAASTRPSIIAVEFSTHDLAARLVEAKRKHGKLLNKDVIQTNNSDSISISFPLSKTQHDLLLITKTRAAQHNVKYVWHSKGSLMIRKSDGARPIKIIDAAHLDTILPPLDSASQATPMDITAGTATSS